MPSSSSPICELLKHKRLSSIAGENLDLQILLGPYFPYMVSIVITLMYSTLGLSSSGEPFDAKKFLTTLAVQVAAMVSIGFAGEPTITALAPSVFTVLFMKAYSIIKKRKMDPASACETKKAAV
jgi:hypothetical protein